MSKKDYSKCLFCGSGDIEKLSMYNHNYGPCPNCGSHNIKYTQNDFLVDPHCGRCFTTSKHKYWPKNAPDKYYYICNSCDAKIYEFDSDTIKKVYGINR